MQGTAQGRGSRGGAGRLCWWVWQQLHGEHLGPVRVSQRSPLSNCSMSKLRLINCMALSGFKDPRCSAKLMDALSPLNLTPKQSLENVPDRHSPSHLSTPGQPCFFGLDSCVQTYVFSWRVCVCICIHMHFQTRAYLHRRACVHSLGNKHTSWSKKYSTGPELLKHQTVHYRITPREMRSSVSLGNNHFMQIEHIANCVT